MWDVGLLRAIGRGLLPTISVPQTVLHGEEKAEGGAREVEACLCGRSLRTQTGSAGPSFPPLGLTFWNEEKGEAGLVGFPPGFHPL